jgi:hypothetical protein
MKKYFAILGAVVIVIAGLTFIALKGKTASSDAIRVEQGHLAFTYVPQDWAIISKDPTSFTARSSDYKEALPDPKMIPECTRDASGYVSEGCAVNRSNELNTPVITQGASLWYSIQGRCDYGESEAQFTARIMRNDQERARGFISERQIPQDGHSGILATYKDGYSLTFKVGHDCQYVEYTYIGATSSAQTEWEHILAGIRIE